MGNFALFASPWWINLFILIPFLAFLLWKNKLDLSLKTLLLAGVFAAAFAFVESAAVVYLREIAGLLPDKLSGLNIPEQTALVSAMPPLILKVEIFREVATLVMIASIAWIARNWLKRLALFFWIFAIWDIFYYVWLYALIGWPASLLSPDILFLIPLPWVSQVWYPILISLLLALAVILGRKNNY